MEKAQVAPSLIDEGGGKTGDKPGPVSTIPALDSRCGRKMLTITPKK